MNITVERGIYLDHKGRARRIGSTHLAANLLGEQAVFLLSKRSAGDGP